MAEEEKGVRMKGYIMRRKLLQFGILVQILNFVAADGILVDVYRNSYGNRLHGRKKEEDVQ